MNYHNSGGNRGSLDGGSSPRRINNFESSHTRSPHLSNKNVSSISATPPTMGRQSSAGPQHDNWPHTRQQSSASVTPGSSNKPPLPQRTPSSSSINANEHSTPKPTRSARLPMVFSDLNENLVSKMRTYVKLMDFACLNSLVKFGLEFPDKDFPSLEDVAHDVDEQNILEYEKKRRNDAERLKTPAQSDNYAVANTRYADTKLTERDKEKEATPSQQPAVVVRRRASRFSDAPPPDKR